MLNYIALEHRSPSKSVDDFVKLLLRWFVIIRRRLRKSDTAD